jgi:integrase
VISNATPRRTRVGLGVYERADGHFEIGWRDAQGKQRWRVVEGGITAARAALATEHAKRARGERVASDPRLTFNAAADAWWDARVVKLRPGTQNAYGAALKHLRAYFGTQRMTHITPTDVARYISKKQAEPRKSQRRQGRDEDTTATAVGFKGWTLKGHLTVLSSIFTYAARHLGLNAQNPVALLDRVERPSSEDERPRRVLNGDELTKLLSAVAESHRLLFDTAAETGGRLAEILGLAWEDIDLGAQTVTFSHQLDRKGQRVPLKTKRSRRVLEVTPSLIARLREHKAAAPGSLPHALVFATRTGRGLDHRNIGGRALASAVKKAGLEAITDNRGVVVKPAPTFHDLRHSHASALIAQGWDVVEVSARLGHASVGTTHRIYAHEFDVARRSDDRRKRLTRLYGSSGVEASVEATDGSRPQQTDQTSQREVVDLQARRVGGQ